MVALTLQVDRVKTRVEPGADLLELAELQSWIVSREQAAAYGVGRHSVARLVDAGRWQRVVPGIYLLRPGDIDWRGRAWAGVLIGGDKARLGGLAAGYLHGLVDDPPETLRILVPEPTRRRDRESWEFRRERPSARQIRSTGSPPRTVIEDNVIDLCDPGFELDGRTPTHWVTAALQRRLTTTERLRRALAERHFVHDRTSLSALISDVGQGAASPLELNYLRDVERAHQLPVGERQSHRRTAGLERGGSAFRDVFYRDFGLVVELDGRVGHIDEGRFRDLRRDNVTALRGERTLRYGWLDVNDEPCQVAFQVAAGLRQGGWTGWLTRCARCRLIPDDILAELAAG